MTSPTDTIFTCKLPTGEVLTATATADCELPDGRFAVTIGSVQPASKLAALRALRDAKRAKPMSRRKRKPSVRSLVKQAERSGKKVMSVTVDGTTLHFSPQPDIESNPWRDDLRKGTMP